MKKILIVDDEETLTWSMARSLSKGNDSYEVLIANNAKEALHVLKNNKIEVVISDIRMPDMNGLDLLVRIKRDYPDTRVVMMTAYGSPNIVIEANRKGALQCIEKPFEISEIKKIVTDLMEQKKGFQGKVVGLQLTDIIQINCLNRLTTALIVSRNGEKGIIYLNEGEVIHAEIGKEKGTQAFYNILSWEDGEFVSNIGVRAPTKTISQNWEHLLVEAVRRNDEKKKSSSVRIPSTH